MRDVWTVTPRATPSSPHRSGQLRGSERAGPDGEIAKSQPRRSRLDAGSLLETQPVVLRTGIWAHRRAVENGPGNAVNIECLNAAIDDNRDMMLFAKAELLAGFCICVGLVWPERRAKPLTILVGPEPSLTGHATGPNWLLRARCTQRGRPRAHERLKLLRRNRCQRPQVHVVL